MLTTKITKISKGDWTLKADPYYWDADGDRDYDSNTITVNEIKEETVCLGKGYYNDITYTVYRGYINGTLDVQVEAGGGLIIEYDTVEVPDEPVEPLSI